MLPQQCTGTRFPSSTRPRRESAPRPRAVPDELGEAKSLAEPEPAHHHTDRTAWIVARRAPHHGSSPTVAGHQRLPCFLLLLLTCCSFSNTACARRCTVTGRREGRRGRRRKRERCVWVEVVVEWGRSGWRRRGGRGEVTGKG